MLTTDCKSWVGPGNPPMPVYLEECCVVCVPAVKTDVGENGTLGGPRGRSEMSVGTRLG